MSAQTKRQKGRIFERWCRDFLQERGWTVRDFPPTSRVLKIKGKTVITSSSQDCFGADLLGVKQGNNGHDEILLVQCTLHKGIKKRLDEFAKYFETKITNLDLQLWIKRDNGEVDVKRVVPGGDVVDLGKIIRRKFYALESGYDF